jgi:hypothetical protein
MTLSIMTLSIMTLSIMTLSIMTLSIMKLSIITLNITISIKYSKLSIKIFSLTTLDTVVLGVIYAESLLY